MLLQDFGSRDDGALGNLLSAFVRASDSISSSNKARPSDRCNA